MVCEIQLDHVCGKKGDSMLWTRGLADYRTLRWTHLADYSDQACAHSISEGYYWYLLMALTTAWFWHRNSCRNTQIHWKKGPTTKSHIRYLLVVWNIFFIFPYIGNLIIPTDELIFFFRGVGQPPTRILVYLKLRKFYSFHWHTLAYPRIIWRTSLDCILLVLGGVWNEHGYPNVQYIIKMYVITIFIWP